MKDGMIETNRSWRPQWIEPEVDVLGKERQPASYVRKGFLLQNKEVRLARLYVTALGVYHAYLNGQKLGPQELTPGYTDYKYRVQYQIHDVTAQLAHGENTLAAVIGDGWYRGCLGIGSKRNQYGSKIKFACCLYVEYADGTSETVQTDHTWKATQSGPLRDNDLKVLERYDARMELDGWNFPGFDDSAWHAVQLTIYSGNVIPQEGEDLLAHERFAATVLHTPDGGIVLDFGQNMSGRVSFSVNGTAGHKVALVMGETLDEDGNFTQKNLHAEGSSLISGELGQRLEYTLREGPQTYAPLFLISGIRYVKLENWPEAALAENFSAMALYSDLPFVGSFSCSNPLINQLVDNVRWSMKSNFVDIPTDCPTRERSGWTADISVFSETACYLADPRRFLRKWLHDYMLEQSADGNLPFVVPEGGKGPRARGCMGWSDSIANLAMTLYRFYGDASILEEVYDSVKRFVDFCEQRARRKNPYLFFKTGKHRRYIIETGFHYGEWLEPGTKMYKDYVRALFVPDTEVTTACFYGTTNLLVAMAELLQKAEDAQYYRNLAQQVRLAYRKEFMPNGMVDSKRACRYLRPLIMNLATEPEQQVIMAAYNRMCADNQYRINTGFLTTWRALNSLAQFGYIDTAYRMLENTQQPGWLYAVTKGATTIWENWFGVDDDGVPLDSHNHYAPGSVVAWLFSTCAGIQPRKPGFEEITIRPIPGGTLTWAKAAYDSCRGKITSAWRIEQGQFYLDVELPTGTPGVIVLPSGETHEVLGGEHHFACAYMALQKEV